jgi:hypothetical protein
MVSATFGQIELAEADPLRAGWNAGWGDWEWDEERLKVSYHSGLLSSHFI